jgi:alcohol dehydrogenase class IV
MVVCKENLIEKIIEYASYQRKLGNKAQLIIMNNDEQMKYLDEIISSLESNGFKVEVYKGLDYIDLDIT